MDGSPLHEYITTNSLILFVVLVFHQSFWYYKAMNNLLGALGTYFYTREFLGPNILSCTLLMNNTEYLQIVLPHPQVANDNFSYSTFLSRLESTHV